MIEIRFPTRAVPPAAPDCMDAPDGEGCICCYPLFEGVDMQVMRLELRSFTERRVRRDEFEINFCVSGRFETSFSPREHVLLGPGDMAVSCFDGIHGAQSEACFPLGYYEGVCIRVSPGPAQQWMNRQAAAFRIDFDALRRSLLGAKWYLFGAAGPRCEHVFRELYENAAYFDEAYLRLKIIELMMLLGRIPRAEDESRYCSAKQLALIRHLRDHLLTDREHYVSLAQLAQEHGISVSHLQKLFKQIYGVPVYHYIKEYRLEQAAVELVRSEKRVMEIALDAGYDNASKFAQCFKKRYGMTPSEYRQRAKPPAKRHSRTKTG